MFVVLIGLNFTSFCEHWVVMNSVYLAHLFAFCFVECIQFIYSISLTNKYKDSCPGETGGRSDSCSWSWNEKSIHQPIKHVLPRDAAGLTTRSRGRNIAAISRTPQGYRLGYQRSQGCRLGYQRLRQGSLAAKSRTPQGRL